MIFQPPRTPRRILFGLAFIIATTSSAAQAAEPSPADKDAARSLVVRGRELLDAERVDEALEHFEKAHAIMGVPSTGYDLARARRAKGLLVEAYDMARQVSLMPPKADEPSAFPWARERARELIEAIEPRLPRLRVEVRGAGGDAYRVTIDGEEVRAQSLSEPLIVNPGAHEIVVTTAPSQGDPVVASQKVRVVEGGRDQIVIVLPPKTSSALDIAPTPASSPGSRFDAVEDPTVATTAPYDEEGAAGPLWPWITGGVGFAFLGVAAGMAVDLASAQTTIDEDCSGINSRGETFCDPDRYDLEQSRALFSRRDRAIGLVAGFGAGGTVLLGAGILGLVMGASGEPSEATTAWRAPVWATAGPGGATLGARWRW